MEKLGSSNFCGTQKLIKNRLKTRTISEAIMSKNLLIY